MTAPITILLLLLARAAAADPTVVAATIDESELASAWGTLADTSEEPTGKLVSATDATRLAKLKLVAGDIIRTVDGHPALGMSRVHPYELGSGNVLYLEVSRGGQLVVVRVAYKVDANQTGTIASDQISGDSAAFRRETSHLRRATKAGKPSGVAVLDTVLVFHSGDLIRSIDGTSVTSPDEVVAALDKASTKASIAIKVDRADTAVAITTKIEKVIPDELQQKIDAGIKKVDDTHYTITRAVVDSVLANPMAVAKGARIVPAVKNGKPDGFKLYAIRPTSVYARLGLQNGDTLAKVNGFSLDSADKALEVYTKLREATSLSVELVRRGKPITLLYSIR